jgi:hypothetical protein
MPLAALASLQLMVTMGVTSPSWNSDFAESIGSGDE